MLKGLTDFKILDNYSQYIAQAPQPIVKIFEYNPQSGIESPVIEFSKKTTKHLYSTKDNEEKNYLQGYSFKFSTSDTDGSFSLILHPGNSDIPYFDEIEPLQIVKIYERDSACKTPDFVGVINRKKFVAQPGSGLRISVTGKSVASFISRFKISLDLNAMSLTNQLVEQSAINTALTTDLLKEKKLKVSKALEVIWEHTVKMSTDFLKLSNSGMKKYIDKYLGSSFFDFDEEIELAYPLANVFGGQNTVMFWDIVSGIIPFPVYEKYAFIDEKGKTKIKIRELPFDCSGDGIGSTWDKIEKNMTELDPAIVKTFDLECSDDEIYTAYFSYIMGSPIEQDKALRLAAQTDGLGANEISINTKKAEIYGYSPLTVSFSGYGKTEKNYTGAGEKLTDLNKRLMNWYGHLEEMLKGTITLSTIMTEQMPMCGEIVSFLGGEFYVNEVEHTWNFGGNPETKLTVSRGGDYSKKKFAQLKGITKRYSIFKKLLETKAYAALNGIEVLKR